jgi:hypothetical protein
LQREEQLIQSTLGGLPEAEATRIRGLTKKQQLTAVRAAAKKVTKEK